MCRRTRSTEYAVMICPQSRPHLRRRYGPEFEEWTFWLQYRKRKRTGSMSPQQLHVRRQKT